MTDELDAAIERLTQGQIDCLLLVKQLMTSKEIAARLGISRHTVDQRIRSAIRVLGCRNRFEAAKLIGTMPMPRAMFQWSPGPVEPLVQRAVSAPLKMPVPLPFATRAHPTNQMSATMRLLWIVVIACGASFSAGVYLAGLESLARLMRGM